MSYDQFFLNDVKLKTPVKKISILLDHGLEENSDFSPNDYNIDYDKRCLKYFNETFYEIKERFKLSVNYINDHTRLFDCLQEDRPDFIINLINYGYLGNEKSEYFPAIFEMLDIPFANAGMSGMALTYDKHILNRIASLHNIPVPAQVLVTTEELLKKKINFEISFPAFLKLRYGKGSCGISTLNYVQEKEELFHNFPKINEDYLQQSLLRHNHWLLQEYLPGPEYNVGVIGNDEELEVFPIIEDRLEDEQYKTYEDKRAEKEALVVAKLSEKNKKIIEDSAKKIYRLLECRDYCRMDFRCNKLGIPMIMDVNPTANYGEKEAFAFSANAFGWDGNYLRQKLFFIALKRNHLLTIN